VCPGTSARCSKNTSGEARTSAKHGEQDHQRQTRRGGGPEPLRQGREARAQPGAGGSRAVRGGARGGAVRGGHRVRRGCTRPRVAISRHVSTTTFGIFLEARKETVRRNDEASRHLSDRPRRVAIGSCRLERGRRGGPCWRCSSSARARSRRGRDMRTRRAPRGAR
jgi:hypothetical protein